MKSIKLNNLAKETLSKKEMNAVKGGTFCMCGCAGSSSTSANGNANVGIGDHGGYSPGIPHKDQVMHHGNK